MGYNINLNIVNKAKNPIPDRLGIRHLVILLQVQSERAGVKILFCEQINVN